MIVYKCICGQLLQVGDALANCRARCPKCRAVNTVPPLVDLPPRADSPILDNDPTVSSEHDLTIKPPQTPPMRKEPGA